MYYTNDNSAAADQTVLSAWNGAVRVFGPTLLKLSPGKNGVGLGAASMSVLNDPGRSGFTCWLIEFLAQLVEADAKSIDFLPNRDDGSATISMEFRKEGDQSNGVRLDFHDGPDDLLSEPANVVRKPAAKRPSEPPSESLTKDRLYEGLFDFEVSDEAFSEQASSLSQESKIWLINKISSRLDLLQKKRQSDAAAERGDYPLAKRIEEVVDKLQRQLPEDVQREKCRDYHDLDNDDGRTGAGADA